MRMKLERWIVNLELIFKLNVIYGELIDYIFITHLFMDNLTISKLYALLK